MSTRTQLPCGAECAGQVPQLLAKGVDPDEVCHDMTLLTHAIDAEGDGALQSGRPLTVHTTAVVLAFGADPQLSGPDGTAPMDLAVHYGHDLAVELLQRHTQREAARASASGQSGHGAFDGPTVPVEPLAEVPSLAGDPILGVMPRPRIHRRR
ncbi:hypothetical protein [Streptomyces sp. NPDC127038]|uniref:hypothetical protein n=1 Tax=Streptomyces sp. NPDC127038 TaxID=3347114 RepID=UPI00365D72F6